jgi:hypothetical protein
MMVAPIPSREPVVHDIAPVFEEVGAIERPVYSCKADGARDKEAYNGD